jgi:hypothetical protein
MSGRTKLLIFLGIGLWLWAEIRPARAGQPSAATSPLKGTFLQLTETHKKWGKAEWAVFFDTLRKLGMSEILIQWSLYDDVSFSTSPDPKTTPNSAIATILELADSARIQVYVGLAYDSKFWQKINRAPELVRVYLKRLYLRSESLGRSLEPLVRSHPSFKGWFIPEEIDDVNWRGAEVRKILFIHLRDTARLLKSLTPGARVAVSGFFGGRMDLQAFEDFWKGLLGEAPVDRVLFQDGIGTRALDWNDLPLYFEAGRRACEARSVNFQVVVELFDQISASPFQARPASWDRVKRQIELASRFAPDGMIGFSVLEYLSPLGGPEAEALLASYLREYQREPSF